jgi:hypothetical protein
MVQLYPNLDGLRINNKGVFTMSFYKISYEIHYSSAKPHHVPCVDEPDYDPVKNRWHFTWGCGYRHPRDAGLELDEAMDAKRDILSAHDNISLRESVICTEIFEENENVYEVVGISVILTEYRAGETRNHRFRAKNVTQMDSIQEAVHRWHCSGELNKLCATCVEY